MFIQSERARLSAPRALTAPASWIAPPKSNSFSVSVVFPASGWEMIAKVLLRRTGSGSLVICFRFERRFWLAPGSLRGSGHAPPRGRSCQLAARRSVAISAKVFVGNLSYHTTAEELTQVLSEAGQVVDVYIPTDRVTGRPRGFAFATFSSEAEAGKAIQLFNQREVGGRRLNVNQAEERPRRPPGERGGYGGGGGGGYGGGGAGPRRFGGGGGGSYGGGGYGGGPRGGGYGGAAFGGGAPPTEDPAFGFEGGRYQPDEEPSGGGGGGDAPGGPRRFKSKGSRRGLRARKRSL